MEEVRAFLFCEKCGAKIFDGAAICENCGCETRAAAQQRSIAERKTKNKMWIIITSATVVLLAIALAAGLFVRKHIHSEEIKDKLAGHTYEHEYLNSVRYALSYYSFDEEANCTYYSYNSYDESEFEYNRDYKVIFENGKVFLKFDDIDVLEVQFNDYGDIECLYFEVFNQKYR